MKKILSIAIAALMFVAQPVMAQNDAKAKAILEGVSKKINGLKTLKANFALTMQGKTKDTKKGAISMKGQKFRMTLDKTEIICDGKTQWTYMKDNKEVQVNNYNPAEQTLSPAKLFSGNYDKDFSYKYTGTRAVGGKNCDIVEMTPTNKSKGFSKVELAVDPKTS
jgi:outer membrane lipoprotein-sorting protein